MIEFFSNLIFTTFTYARPFFTLHNYEYKSNNHFKIAQNLQNQLIYRRNPNTWGEKVEKITFVKYGRRQVERSGTPFVSLSLSRGWKLQQSEFSKISVFLNLFGIGRK